MMADVVKSILNVIGIGVETAKVSGYYCQVKVVSEDEMETDTESNEGYFRTCYICYLAISYSPDSHFDLRISA